MARESDVLQGPPIAVIPHLPLPPPPELTDEQQAAWREICAHGRFHPDCRPVLRELCRHMAYSSQIAAALDALRHVRLARSPERRAVFAQLLALHREQSKAIASLCTKLRMTSQSQIELRRAEAARRVTPTAPAPWLGGGRRDESN